MFDEEKKSEEEEHVEEDPIEEKMDKNKPWYKWRDDESIEEKRARERAYRILPTA